MRIFTAVLALVFLLLQGQLWFGHGGLPDLWRLQRSIEAQQQENERLEERNEALAAEVQDLKSGLQAIEERARTELGMIRRGETFYQVTDRSAPEDESSPEDLPDEETAND